VREWSFEPFAKSVSSIRSISVNDKVESGTDTLPFSIAGLPGINMDQDSPDYKYTHHSPADALEAVNPEVLAQNATLMALTAYWIAPAGAFCFAVAGGKNREDAASAAPGRNAQGVWIVVQGVCGGGKERKSPEVVE
jgi:hypothetical protein